MKRGNISMEKKNAVLIVLAVVLALSAISVGGYFVYDRSQKENAEINNNDNIDNEENQNNENEINEITQLERGTFRIVDEERFGLYGIGSVQVEGHVTKESKCSNSSNVEDCTEFVDYISFHVLRTENSDFQRSINGVSHVGRNSSIILGCLRDEVLEYDNITITGPTSGKLSNIDTERLMNSTRVNPVILNLEVPEFPDGFGITSCYSPVTILKIS